MKLINTHWTRGGTGITNFNVERLGEMVQDVHYIVCLSMEI